MTNLCSRFGRLVSTENVSMQHAHHDTMQEFHMRYHEKTGITFASLYPGCIATTGLFREHIPLYRLLFPSFRKYITKGYVSEDEAGKRLYYTDFDIAPVINWLLRLWVNQA
ncbi:hypothetical protein Ddye_026920 [Dipteronia dyeriana]|uniref:Protochlorophyllide reductase n=1 Tax=Dipteronia dyeriana TaxID=168575 RepID=A0AAD9TN55_9ROSI|nr:hypothetical protein Ddye_026920 [Dipteronia dyeriana]